MLLKQNILKYVEIINNYCRKCRTVTDDNKKISNRITPAFFNALFHNVVMGV